MTRNELRDEFAKAALQGFLSDPGTRGTAEELAASSYDMADAMVNEKYDRERAERERERAEL